MVQLGGEVIYGVLVLQVIPITATVLPLVLLSDLNKFLMPQALFRSIINYTNVDYDMMNTMSFVYIMPSLLFFFARR